VAILEAGNVSSKSSDEIEELRGSA